MSAVTSYSDFLIFVDESGDHGLECVDPNYPIFVLAFCVIRKEDYIRQLTPAMQEMKCRHFGHDNIILHERDIRKDTGDFTSLRPSERKQAFMDELTQLIANTNFTLICCAIRKEHLLSRYSHPENPYHIALGFGLERVFNYLKSHHAVNAVTHVMVERRGRREDNELELEFRRICDGNNFHRQPLPFEIEFQDKKCNSSGLQLTDLVARPVGVHVLRPEQPNRAYEVLQKKLYKSTSGKVQGWGIKCFP